MEKDFLELLELQTLIREGIEDALPEAVRVRAEIASLQHRANGHCYLELCESGPRGPVAKVRAVIWRGRYEFIVQKFSQVSGGSLSPGMSLIFEATVNYSELYGLSLVIEDIDVEHTLGEAELLRRQTIERLEKEDLMDLQKELVLPPVPYSLAVISAPDAAGYGDFRRHLLENEYGFAFSVTLFPATMQGDTAPASIIAALERIEYGTAACSESGLEAQRADAGGVGGNAPRPLGVQGDNSEHGVVFDAVFILRGGGSVLDLACFDDYDLCAAIARFPLPVYTAIGHDRDVHIADMVACGSVKTPTALADLCIDAVADEDRRIEDIGHRIRMALVSRISAQEGALAALEARIAAANPAKLLERGYTLVADARGVLIKKAAGVSAGDKITVRFPDGTLKCTVDGKV